MLGRNGAVLLSGNLAQLSPAEQAGLLVPAISSPPSTAISKVSNATDLRFVVAQLPIGKQVTVDYIRGGTAQSVEVKIAEVPNDLQPKINVGQGQGLGSNQSLPQLAQPAATNVLTGLEVSTLDDKSRQKFGVDALVKSGVLITNVQEGSLAELKGITHGDVIESANIEHGPTSQFTNANDFANLVKTLKPDQSVVLLIHHGKGEQFCLSVGT